MKITASILIIALVLGSACKKAPERLHFFSSDAETEDPDPETENSEEESKNSTSTPTVAVPPTALTFTTALPRLTHAQWANSVRDILLFDAQRPVVDLSKFTSLFNQDPQNTFFGNDGNSLVVSDALWQSYVSASESIAAAVASDQAQVAKLVPAGAAALPDDQKASVIIVALTQRAFRRPLSDAQGARLLALYKDGKTLTGRTDATAAGLQVLIEAVLQSPYFIYRVELGKAKTDLASLTSWEVAARLSYAAWQTIPDTELFASAASGEILTDDGLKKQAIRLIGDSRADPILVDFYRKILKTDAYSDVPKKDPSVAAKWPDDIGKTLVKEADLFLNEVVVKENGGINQILTAPYAFVSSATAPFYKVAAPSGTDIVKTVLDSKERMGILTQVGFLARQSLTKDSNAIRRGRLVSEEILCPIITETIPANIPPLPSSGTQTARKGIETLTGKGTCGGACHGSYINPSGFPFENYDAAGNYRTTDNGQPVDASGTVILKKSSITYTGPQDFLQKITKSTDVHSCMMEKAVSLFYARKVDSQDSTLIGALANKSMTGTSTRELFFNLLIDSRIKLRGNKGK